MGHRYLSWRQARTPGLAHADKTVLTKLGLHSIAKYILLGLAEPAAELMELLDPLVFEIEGHLSALYSCCFSHGTYINWRPVVTPTVG